MKKLLLPMIIASLVSGCAMFTEDELVQQDVVDTVETVNSNSGMPASSMSILKSTISHDSSGSRLHQTKWFKTVNPTPNIQKNINHYARGIMQDLLSNLQYVSASTPLAVADFLYLDSDFDASTLLGRQIAEALTHEVHKLGIPVVDYKLTEFIRVTPNGDFALSKDYLELSGDIPIRYILTGTLVEDRGTTIVNARIVGVTSKAIVASAQTVIPNSIALDIKKGNSRDGLY